MEDFLGLIIAVQMIIVWGILNLIAQTAYGRRAKRRVTTLQGFHRFLEEGNECPSQERLLSLVRSTAQELFGADRFVAFKPQSKGGWRLDAKTPVAGPQGEALGVLNQRRLPSPRTGLEDPALADLAQPLGELMDQHGLDVLVPVRDGGQPVWVTGMHIPLGSKQPENDMLRAWQVAVSASTTSLSLRTAVREQMAMAKDADMAGEVLSVLLPDEPFERIGHFEWAGVLEPTETEGPRLFAAYPQGRDRLLVIFGEVIAPGLAATILTSAIRGCCDFLVASRGDDARPDWLLGRLNRYLWRPTRPIGMSCLAVLLDREQNKATYACAGLMPWLRVRGSGDSADIANLAKIGPALGDAPNVEFMPWTAEIAPGDRCIFLGGEVGERMDTALSSATFRNVLAESGRASFDDIGDLLRPAGASLKATGATNHSAIVVLRNLAG